MCVLRSAGNWLFCNRRWLDPSHPQDRARLDAGYDALCAAFPAFAACPRAAFLARLAHVSAAWSAAQHRPPRTTAGRPGLADSDNVGDSDLDSQSPLSSVSVHLSRPAALSHGAPAGREATGSGCGCRPSAAAIAIRVPQLLNPAPEALQVGLGCRLGAAGPAAR